MDFFIVIVVIRPCETFVPPSSGQKGSDKLEVVVEGLTRERRILAFPEGLCVVGARIDGTIRKERSAKWQWAIDFIDRMHT